MIIIKDFKTKRKSHKNSEGNVVYKVKEWRGWFLFGFIPLVIQRKKVYYWQFNCLTIFCVFDKIIAVVT